MKRNPFQLQKKQSKILFYHNKISCSANIAKTVWGIINIEVENQNVNTNNNNLIIKKDGKTFSNSRDISNIFVIYIL